MARVENEFAAAGFDAAGRLVSLCNKTAKREFVAAPGDFFRIIYSENESLEEEAYAHDFECKTVQRSQNSLTLEYTKKLFCRVTVNCSLEHESFTFSCTLENLSDGNIIREFQFPYIQNTALTDKTRLHRNSVSGEFRDNITKWLDDSFTAYMAPDENAHENSSLYPGVCSMNFFILVDRNTDTK